MEVNVFDQAGNQHPNGCRCALCDTKAQIQEANAEQDQRVVTHVYADDTTKEDAERSIRKGLSYRGGGDLGEIHLHPAGADCSILTCRRVTAYEGWPPR